MKITLVTILLIFSIQSPAQIIFQDDFSTNNNTWSFIKTKHFNLKIKKNALEIEKKAESDNRSACLWYSKKIEKLNTANDFSIEFDFKILESVDEIAIVDFSWGNIKTNAAFFQFTCNVNGKFGFGIFESENIPRKWTYPIWVSRPELLKLDSFNKIKIIQEGDTCSIILNDVQIIQQKINRIKGSDIGFLQCNKVKWVLDNLVIKQMNI